jgi:hypothetical protein
MVFIKFHNGKKDPVMLKALLDTGAGNSLVASRHTKNIRTMGDNAHWKTVAGNFSTEGTVETKFQLPELNPIATINYKLHVSNSLGVYDMILGRDLLKDLGLIIDYSTKSIIWNDAIIPMKGSTATVTESFHIQDPAGIDEMVGRLAGDKYKTILDAKYKKANLEKEIEDNCPQLNSKQRKTLLKLLTKFEDLFDGTLGKWKNTKYDIELKEGAKPYHSRPYSIPKAYEQQLRVEVERLVKIGVLRKIN